MPTYDTRASIGFDLRATGREVPRQLRDDVADLRRELDGFQSTLERGNASSRESAEAFALLASRALAAREAFRELAGAPARASGAAAINEEVEALGRLRAAVEAIRAAQSGNANTRQALSLAGGLEDEIATLGRLVAVMAEATGARAESASSLADESRALDQNSASLRQSSAAREAVTGEIREQAAALDRLRRAMADVEAVRSAGSASLGGESVASAAIAEEVRTLGALAAALREATEATIASQQAALSRAQASEAASDQEARQSREVAAARLELVEGYGAAQRAAEVAARAQEQAAARVARAEEEAARVRSRTAAEAERLERQAAAAAEAAATASVNAAEKRAKADAVAETAVKTRANAQGVADRAREAAASKQAAADELALKAIAARAEAERQAAGATTASVEQQIEGYRQLYEALGRMEAQGHDDRAVGVNDPRTAQAIADAQEEFNVRAELQARLREMDRRSAEEARENAAATAAARRQGTQAVVDTIAATRKEAEASREAREAQGEAMRARIDAGARAERQQEQAAAAAIQQAGDEKRARIDAYAAEERAIESAASKQRAADEAIKLEIGELKRQRIDAYAAADEAIERNRQAAIQQAGDEKRARIDAYAGADLAADNLKRATARYREELGLAGISVQNLDAQLQGLSPQEIDRLTESSKQARLAIEADLVPLGQLSDAAMKFRSDQIDKVNTATQQLKDSFTKAGMSAQEANAKIAGMSPKQITDAADALKKADASSRSWHSNLYQVAYAIDDVQYGLRGIGNQIPQLVQLVGLTGGWAGGIAVAATTASVLASNFGPSMSQVTAALGLTEDKTRTFATSVEDAKAKLDALKGQTYKVDVDYARITEAEILLDKMEKRLAAFKAAERDNIQEVTAKQTKDIAGDFGGSGALQKIIGDVFAARGTSFVSAEVAEDLRYWKEQIKDLDQLRNKDGSLPADFEDALRYYQGEVAKAQNKARTQQAEGAAKVVSDFNLGDYNAIKQVQQMVRDFPGAFNAVGPEDLTIGERINNLASSRGEALKLFDADKSIESAEKELTQFVQRVQRDKAKLNQTVATLKDAYKDSLEADLYNALKDLALPDRAGAVAKFMEANRGRIAGEVNTRLGLGAGNNRGADVAAEMIKDAATAAQNDISSGDLPKILKEQQRAEARANKAGAREFSKEVKDTARRIGPGVDDELEAMILAAEAGGATPERAVADVTPKVERWVRGHGVAAEQVEQVAATVIDKAMVATGRDLDQSPLPRAQAAGEALALRIQKLEAKAQAQDRQADTVESRQRQDFFGGVARQQFGANDFQAEQIGRKANQWFERGANPEQALMAAFRELMADNQQARGKLRRLEQMGWGMANNLRANRRQQGRFAQQMPPVGDIFVPMGGGAW